MELPISKYKREEDDLENYDEIHPNLIKVYEKYNAKINSISTTINISEIIGYISFLTFLIMLAIRLSPELSFNWLILLIPALICLVSFTILLNMYLRLKDLFDQSEIIQEEKSNNLGSILSYFCLNTGSVSIIIYLVLLSLQLQGYILIKLNEVAIPLYIFLGISLFYYTFIFPAFLKNKLIFPLAMTGLYIIASFVFFAMINTKIDSRSTGLFINIFLTLLIAIFFHIMCYFYLLVATQTKFVNIISIVVSLSLILAGILLIGLKLDNFVSIDNWIPIVIFIIAYITLISDKLFHWFEKNNSS